MTAAFRSRNVMCPSCSRRLFRVCWGRPQIPHGLLVFLTVALATPAWARNVEPGAVSLATQVGPALRLDSSLSGARTYALLAGEVDYAFDKNLSAVADLGVGLGNGTPVRLHVGGRLRLADLGVPISPYIQGQLGVGWLFDLLGADLTYFGVRVGAGADYLFTERWSTGVLAAFDLGGTTAARAAFFGTFDLLAYVSVTL
jgi:hypothetical protein